MMEVLTTVFLIGGIVLCGLAIAYLVIVLIDELS